MFAALLTVSCLSASMTAFAEADNATGENDTIATAEEIAFETDTTGIILEGDTDYYKITTTEDGAIVMDIAFSKSFLGSYLVSFYTEDGTCYYEYRPDENTRLDFGNRKAGSYYISVASGYTRNTNPYTITPHFTAADGSASVEMESNNTMETANPLELNTSINGDLAYWHGYDSYDMDFYQITLVEDGLLTLKLSCTANASSAKRFEMVLYKDESTAVSSQTMYVKDGKAETPALGLSAGTYYCKVYENDGSWYTDADYTLQASFTAASEKLTEIEANDTMDTATAIPVASACTGTLSNDTDVDYYSFTIDKPSEVSVTFARPEQGNSSYRYWWVALQDSEETFTEIEALGGKLSDTSETVTLMAGTYYVRVRSQVHSDANYTLTVNAEELQYDMGDVNMDGKVDAADVYEMLLSVAYSGAGIDENQLSGLKFLAADVDGDGDLTTDDIYCVLYYGALSGAGYTPDWNEIIR